MRAAAFSALRIAFSQRFRFSLTMTSLATRPLAAPDFARFEPLVAPYREAQELARGLEPAQINANLGKIWLPGFRRPFCATRYFRNMQLAAPAYGAALFPDSPNATEALFGLMAYHVDREVVLSLGRRLTELGEQTVTAQDGTATALPMNLQERPDGNIGAQALILSPRAGVDTAALEAALIAAIEIDGAVSVTKSTPDAKRRQNVAAHFVIPETISWDGRAHGVDVSFTVELPRDGARRFQDWLMGALHLVNGRPAQHYQDQAAAIIGLEEILFAKPESVRVIVDAGTPSAFAAAPDKFLGKKIALLLTQTAGGFFERAYLQTRGASGPIITQKTPDGGKTTDSTVSFVTVNGVSQRVTDVGYAALATASRVVENELTLADGTRVYELTHTAVRDASGNELVAIDFSTGDGRGIRDLGRASDQEQAGRFKMSLNGKEGFAYGEFFVSPTQPLDTADGTPAYYNSITLLPKHSGDMARKKIVLHVIQTKDGVYTETQVVPESLVVAPPQKIARAPRR